MSFIYNELKKKKYFSDYIFPERITSKDLINNLDAAVVTILKPDMTREIFMEKIKIAKVIRDLVCQIPENRTDYYIFMIDCKEGIFYRSYPKGVPLSVIKYKNDAGQYDRDLGFDIWMLKFSSYFVSKKSVILGKPEIYHKFMESIKDCLVKDELSGVSGLLSLQYS